MLLVFEFGFNYTGSRMELADRHVVITGAARGIGRALAVRMAAESPRALVVADLDGPGAEALAREIGAVAVQVDVRREGDIRSLIDGAQAAAGPIDLFCSNAGAPGAAGGPEASDADWQATWEANVMAHVWAARALVPGMVARGEGYLLNTASAAGLLTQVSALPYTVTKHAAVALAEWLAINYADAGIRVSCLCPQAVRTAMLDLALEEPIGAAALLAGGILTPEEVAESVVAGIRDEVFLILPHTRVAQGMAHKGSDPEGWLRRMRSFVREARRDHQTREIGAR
jgi:NAD(P)-dependent dehydrogenase (short-subunit alcohol dehydrogenase family)